MTRSEAFAAARDERGAETSDAESASSTKAGILRRKLKLTVVRMRMKGLSWTMVLILDSSNGVDFVSVSPRFVWILRRQCEPSNEFLAILQSLGLEGWIASNGNDLRGISNGTHGRLLNHPIKLPNESPGTRTLLDVLRRLTKSIMFRKPDAETRRRGTAHNPPYYPHARRASRNLLPVM